MVILPWFKSCLHILSKNTYYDVGQWAHTKSIQITCLSLPNQYLTSFLLPVSILTSSAAYCQKKLKHYLIKNTKSWFHISILSCSKQPKGIKLTQHQNQARGKTKCQNCICEAGKLFRLKGAALTFSILSSHSLFWANSAMKAWCFSHFLWSFWVSSRLLSLAISIFSHTQSPSWKTERERQTCQYWMSKHSVNNWWCV